MAVNPVPLRPTLGTCGFVAITIAPKEKEREFIDYMTISEFCEAVGYSKSHARKLINTLSTITFNGQHALIYITMDFNIDKSKITMNPNLYWAGSDWNHVKYLAYWFKD